MFELFVAREYSEQKYTYDSIKAEYQGKLQSQSPLEKYPVRPVASSGTLKDPNATYFNHLRAEIPAWPNEPFMHGLMNVSLLITSISFVLLVVYKFILVRLMERQKVALVSALSAEVANSS